LKTSHDNSVVDTKLKIVVRADVYAIAYEGNSECYRVGVLVDVVEAREQMRLIRDVDMSLKSAVMSLCFLSTFLDLFKLLCSTFSGKTL
jgi:hypothetical protein